jgi:predicted O-linked N-acetylglucosamine transferase (SPINDLY family)
MSETAEGEARFRAGVKAHGEGRLLEAKAAYAAVVDADPAHIDAITNLSVLSLQLGDAGGAERLGREAVRLAPERANGWNNLGLALKAQGNFADAARAFRRCVALDRSHQHAWGNLGEALANIGDLEGAIAAYGEALAIDPDMPATLLAYIHRKQQAADWAGLDAAIERLSRLIARGRSGIEPFGLLFCCQDPAEILRSARNCARALKESVAKTWGATDFVRRKREGGRIRIGYVSANFSDHAVGTLIAQMLETHDRSRFAVHGYCHSEVREGDLRQRIVRAFDAFTEIHALNDLEAARAISRDGIDILVDLMGYTRGHRLRIFALKPAPVQVSWIGYAGSIGRGIVDYIIADRVVVPPGMERFYDEAVVFMPVCYQVNDAQRRLAHPPPRRADFGLAEDTIVYCCFNQTAKITPPAVDLWAHILKAVPESVLWLWHLNDPGRRNLTSAFAGRGVAPGRILWGETLDGPAHLSRYGLCDLFLDTFPYGGHATASNALFGGCPLVALPGNTFASRVSASLLNAIGLGELIARDAAHYGRIAVAVGRDRALRDRLKRHLAAARSTSALFDGARFARDLERAFEIMVARHERGEPAAAIAL